MANAIFASPGRRQRLAPPHTEEGVLMYIGTMIYTWLNGVLVGTAQFGMPYGIANQDGQVRGDEREALPQEAQSRPLRRRVPNGEGIEEGTGTCNWSL